MKKSLLLLAFSWCFYAAYSQTYTPLYAGIRYNNELVEIDTTGATLTIVGTTNMTTDAGTVNGSFGLALDPTTDEMYILYENGSGECDRHLGILDVTTGAISDIGNAGNLVDIDFGPDGSLYGTTGASCAPEYSFVLINKVTASYTVLFDHLSSTYGSTIGYNPFTSEMIHVSRNDFSTINLGTLVETDGTPTAHPGESHAIVVLRPDLAWVINYEELHTFNPLTGVFSYVEDQPDDYHAMTFGVPACTPMELLLTGTSVCEGTEVTLDAEGMGDVITWDGGILDGVPFLPGPAGTYTYTATSDDDGDCPLPVEVIVYGLPTVIAGAGDENYCEGESIVLSAGGDADEYTWDPLDFTPGVGTHTYTLTGAYEIGCENSATVDITVHPLPTITANVDDDLICFGAEIVLSGGGGVSYAWDEAGVTDSEPYTPMLTGTITYTVIGTDLNGCENSAEIEVEVLEQIEITGVTTDEISGADGAIDISFTGGAPSYMVDWNNDETGDFDDPADITGLTAGTYTVVVKGSQGCENTATFVVNSQLGVESFNAENIQIYPNPVTDFLTIELPGNFNFELLNINGDLLLKGSALDKKTISLEDFSAGVYFVKLDGAGTTTVKVVKN